MIPSMNLFVNGHPFQMETPASLADLLQRLDLPNLRVAVERNQEVVPRAQWPTEHLAEGDRIEVVQFVGGGC